MGSLVKWDGRASEGTQSCSGRNADKDLTVSPKRVPFPLSPVSLSLPSLSSLLFPLPPSFFLSVYFTCGIFIIFLLE